MEFPSRLRAQTGGDMAPLKVSYATQEKLIQVAALQGDREREHLSGSKFTALQSCELTLCLYPFSFLWILCKQKHFISSRKPLEQSHLG